MQDRVRVFAEGEIAGVLVRRQRWQVLARFHGPEAEQLARDLAALICDGRLRTGADLAADASSSGD